MRRMVVTRGAPGCGKSTVLREVGLEGHTLSADAIRDVLSGPSLSAQGGWERRQDNNPRVWRTLYDLLEERMRRGEFVAVDATHADLADLKRYADMADRFGYARPALLDFSGIDVERAVANNRSRPEPDRVPEAAVRGVHERIARRQDGEALKRYETLDAISPEAVRRLDEMTRLPVEDLSGWSRIHHLGDLQGCRSVLDKPGSPLADGLRDDELHIFVGDFLDRGPENADAFRFAVEELVGRPNVRILRGNHELHLERWARGEDPVSKEFERRTLPQLEAAGFKPEDAEPLASALEDAILYRWRGECVMVTHAGLSTVPDRMALVSSHQLTHGTGFFTSPVDRQFDENAPAGWKQVHGHRNHGGLPVRASERSFNLEDDIEHGGAFRAITLGDDGWTATSVRNDVFRPIRERGQFKDAPHRAPWLRRPDDGKTVMSEAEMAEMREHNLVREHVPETMPHVSSFAFTKKAFQKGLWDEVTQRARGLHVNNRTGTVIARAYDKFFNIGEREETTLESLLDGGGLSFPVRAFVKENGYLGIVGYDDEQDDLYVSSKSRPEGWFSDRLREILWAETDERTREVMRRRLRDEETCLTLEVNDPVHDPHMIEYDRPHLVLLNVVRRATEFEQAPFDEKGPDKRKRVSVESWAKDIGVRCKEPGPTFQDAESLRKWLDSIDRYDHRHKFRDGRREPVEGYVLEDANGYLTKWKSPYYSFWKYARSLKDRVLKIRGTESRLGRDTSDPAIADFVSWCREQPDETLSKDIITVRKEYLSERPDPTVLRSGLESETEEISPSSPRRP